MATWNTYASPNLAGAFLDDMIAVAADTFVGVGTGGAVIRSTDGGQTWTTPTAAEANEWRGLAFNGTTVVAVANGGVNRVMTSSDLGATWASQSAAEANQWNAVTYSSALGLFVAVAESGANRVMTSADEGVTWLPHAASSAHAWSGVAASPTGVVAISAGDGATMSSADASTWADSTALSSFTAANSFGSAGIVYSTGANTFAVGGYDGVNKAKVAFSNDDGATWTYVASAPLDTYFEIFSCLAAPAIGGFVGSLPFLSDLTPSPTIIGSSVDDGASWTAEDTTESGTWGTAAWDNDTGTVVFWDITGQLTVLVGIFDIVNVTDVSPDHGDAAGGTVVTLTGTGFTGATSVMFGATAATAVNVLSDTSLTCIAPAHTVGDVTVTVS